MSEISTSTLSVWGHQAEAARFHTTIRIEKTGVAVVVSHQGVRVERVVAYREIGGAKEMRAPRDVYADLITLEIASCNEAVADHLRNRESLRPDRQSRRQTKGPE